MQTRINQVKAVYKDLVAQLADMDDQLAQVIAQEDQKRLELAPAPCSAGGPRTKCV